MYEIEISDSQDILPLDQTFLRTVAEKTLSEEGVVSAIISLAFVNNQTIRKINKQYLEHDYDTDVLSFLLECEGPEEENGETQPQLRGRGKRIEGEVIVSTETAFQTAGEFHWRPQDEVVLYLIHGLLHLAGYDDLSPSEKTVMRARERDILKLFELTPHYDDMSSSDSASQPGVGS